MTIIILECELEVQVMPQREMEWVNGAQRYCPLTTSSSRKERTQGEALTWSSLTATSIVSRHLAWWDFNAEMNMGGKGHEGGTFLDS